MDSRKKEQVREVKFFNAIIKKMNLKRRKKKKKKIFLILKNVNVRRKNNC